MIEESNNNNDILDNIISSSEDAGLQISEDVYDASGQKLLAKGYKVTPSIRQKMLNKVLKKPIETCITTEDGITNEDIATTAQSLINRCTLLKTLSVNVGDKVNALRDIHLAPLASMLLTVMNSGDGQMFNHAVHVTLIARIIAKKMGLGKQDIINLTVAGLLHDVGELYASVPQAGALNKEQWRKVMIHPILGRDVVKMYMDYPDAVSAAIYEHHARCNDTGYPKNLDADRCSDIGQILILAEATAGMLKPGVEARNLSVAFNLSHGVYPNKPLTVMNQMLKSLPHVRAEVDKKNVIERLTRKISTLNDVQLKLQHFLDKEDYPHLVQQSATHLKSRVEGLKRSIFDAGTHYYLKEISWVNAENDQIVMYELENTTREIGWQIQDMLRDMALHLGDSRYELPTELSEITQQLAQIYLKKN